MAKIKNFKSSNGGNDRILLILAVIVALVSFVAFVVSYWTVGITGYEVLTNASSGTVNLSIPSALVLNFSINKIDWGSGAVPGGTVACLDSAAAVIPATGTGNFGATCGTAVPGLGGEWNRANVVPPVLIPTGLRLDNIGNKNLKVTLKTGKTAASFFPGGSGGAFTPYYAYNVSRVGPTTSSCMPPPGTLGNYIVVNTIHPGTLICNNLNSNPGGSNNNSIRIDVRLEVPYDTSATGAIGDVITAIGEQA